MLGALVKKVFGGNKQQRDMRALMPIVAQINEEYEKLHNLSDEQLRAKTDEFRQTTRRQEMGCRR